MVPHVQEEELELNTEVDTANYEAAEEFVVAEALTPKTQHTPVTLESAMSLDAVIAYLESMNGRMLQAEVLKTENERLKLEIKGLKKRNEDLENKISHLEQNSGLMQEDYETLMNIMNRARKLVLLEEEERPATKFKMDRNGNLEKMAE
jgi:prespore-specific regulator